MTKLFFLSKQFISKMIVCSIVVLLAACSGDDDAANADTTNTLTANAGVDQNIATLVEVVLDGTASSDSANAVFEYSWAFISRPNGSLSVLEAANTASPSFLPDLNGVYEIRLTIRNAEFESSDTVSVTVSQATPNTAIELGGAIREDMVLTNTVATPGVPDYCVTRNIDLSAVMTIEPGVEIQFAPDVEFVVSGDDAALVARGTDANHIVFTAKDTSRPWRGLAFVLAGDFRNELDYVDISYAGIDLISIVDREASLGVSSFSQLSVTNTTITNSASAGMFIESDVALNAFANNSFSNNAGRPLVLAAEQVAILDAASSFSQNNGDNSIEIHNGSIATGEAVSWVNIEDGTPYVVTSDINLSDKLTISPGVELRFDVDRSFVVDGDGAIIAEGTAEDPIVFTAVETTAPWRGIAVLSDNFENTLDHVMISYAGADLISIVDEKVALGISSFGVLSVSNTTIAHSVNHGMLIERNVDASGFENNNFENNAGTPLIVSVQSLHQLDTATRFGASNGANFVEVLGGTSNESSEISWSGFSDGTPFFVSDNINVRGEGVTVAPNTTFQFASDTFIRIDGNDTFFSAEGGNASGRIVFTAFNQSLPWRGMSFLTDNVRNTLDFVEVSYAGSSALGNISRRANVGVGSFNRLELTNAVITHGEGYGVVVNSSAEVNLNIEASNDLSNNALGNVFFE